MDIIIVCSVCIRKPILFMTTGSILSFIFLMNLVIFNNKKCFVILSAQSRWFLGWLLASEMANQYKRL